MSTEGVFGIPLSNVLLYYSLLPTNLSDIAALIKGNGGVVFVLLYALWCVHMHVCMRCVRVTCGVRACVVCAVCLYFIFEAPTTSNNNTSSGGKKLPASGAFADIPLKACLFVCTPIRVLAHTHTPTCNSQI